MAVLEQRRLAVVIISAHELTRTLICAAERCEHDAEPNSTLCYRCAKKPAVKLHHIQQPRIPNPQTELCCATCGEWKPDTAYSHDRQSTKWATRGRKRSCKPCESRTRRAYRQNLDPDKRNEQRRRDRERKSALKARLGWPPS